MADSLSIANWLEKAKKYYTAYTQYKNETNKDSKDSQALIDAMLKEIEAMPATPVAIDKKIEIDGVTFTAASSYKMFAPASQYSTLKFSDEAENLLTANYHFTYLPTEKGIEILLEDNDIADHIKASIYGELGFHIQKAFEIATDAKEAVIKMDDALIIKLKNQNATAALIKLLDKAGFKCNKKNVLVSAERKM